MKKSKKHFITAISLIIFLFSIFCTYFTSRRIIKFLKNLLFIDLYTDFFDKHFKLAMIASQAISIFVSLFILVVLWLLAGILVKKIYFSISKDS